MKNLLLILYGPMNIIRFRGVKINMFGFCASLALEVSDKIKLNNNEIIKKNSQD